MASTIKGIEAVKPKPGKASGAARLAERLYAKRPSDGDILKAYWGSGE